MSFLLGLCQHSNQYKLRQRFGEDPVVKALYNEYFSAYSKNLLSLDSATLDRIDQVVKRRMAGLQIAQNWAPVLVGNDLGVALDGTHRILPDELLLERSLKAQFIFDRELTRLKKLDRFKVFREERVIPELNMLKRAISYRSYLFCLAPRFSKREKTILGELKETAKRNGKTFTCHVEESIRMREALLRDIDGKIGLIDREGSDSPFLSPESGEMRELLFASQRVRPRDVDQSETLHPCLRDHSVISIGDPISDPDAKFLIVKRPSEMPDEVWLQLISQKNTDLLLREITRAPIPFNEARLFDFGSYKVEIGCERVADTLKLHEDRDFYEKTHRKKLADCRYERTIRPETGWVKNAIRSIISRNWSEHREATAGADCHELKVVNRTLIHKILMGKQSQISQNTAHHLGEYAFALPGTDIARLRGSYMEDEGFLQALRLQEMIYEREQTFYEDGMILKFLEGEGGYENGKYGPRLDQLVANVFEKYSDWALNLQTFLDQIRSPKNKKARVALGEQFVADLHALLLDLETFLREAPHPEIVPVIRARALLPAVDMRGRDGVWSGWKRGKTPEEIERILGESCVRIDRGLHQLAANLLKVSIPTSSGQFKGAVLEAMDPSLVPIYDKAIPPIWQNKARLGLLKKELLEGTELSPTWLRMAEMLASGDARLMRNEFERSRLSKFDISR